MREPLLKKGSCWPSSKIAMRSFVLQAAQASEQQAEASLRQAESRIGLVQGGKFDANNVPEVLSAKASYDSAVAQAKMSEADAQRYDASDQDRRRLAKRLRQGAHPSRHRQGADQFRAAAL